MKYLQFFFLIFCLIGCSGKPDIIPFHGDAVQHAGQTIYVANHGWHTGFVIPAGAVFRVIPELKIRFEEPDFFEIGWGDKGFYQAQSITVGLTIRAIFWPTESAMHVVAVPGSPVQYFSASDVQPICVNEEQLNNLLKFIRASFLTGSEEALVAQARGLYGDSQFYEGMGEYYLMNTCNKWTTKGLLSTGFDVSPTFKLTATSVMSAVEEIQHLPSQECF